MRRGYTPPVEVVDFINRLLHSGLIKPQELEHKYRQEIQANEIVLLAYYIAAINIEATYHSLTSGQYLPFEGICLTDTIQLYKQENRRCQRRARRADRSMILNFKRA